MTNRREKVRKQLQGEKQIKPSPKPKEKEQVALRENNPNVLTLENVLDSDNAVNSEEILSPSDIFNSLQSIDTFIGRGYLTKIGNSEIVPLKILNEKGEEVFNLPGYPENLPSFRWYEIDRIIYEKDVFFADKYSMLFTALHEEAAQVVLVLDKKNGITKLYLGARDNNNKAYNRSGETLDAAISGFLTGVHTTEVCANELKSLTEIYKTPSVACVSGVASFRDDKKEEFIQGLERLINSTSAIPSYSAFFIADTVSEQERISIVNAFQQIYRQLSPLEEFQTSLSISETSSLTDTVSEGITKTVGKTIGRTITNGTSFTSTNTVTNGTSKSDSNTEGWSKSKSKGGSFNFTPFGIGFSRNRNRSEGTNGSKSHSETKIDQSASAVSKGNTHQTSDSTQEMNQEAKLNQVAKAKSIGETESTTLQITTKDLHVKDLMDTIETQIHRLRNAAPFGLWNCATYFVSNSESTSRKIASIYKGTIIGEESGLEVTALNSWEENNPLNTEITKYLANGMNPRFIVDGQNVSAGTTVSSKEIAIHMALPQSSVPGIIVQTRASFGRNVTRYSLSQTENETPEKVKKSEGAIQLGHVLHLGEIDEKSPVCIDVDDLSRHCFVTGTTGSGKSNAMYQILKSLYDLEKKFLVIEPKKGEYKNILGGYRGVEVYGTNPYESKLLTINPFSFDCDKGIMVYEHVDRLVEIFNACWPMYAAMPEVLKKSILDAYKNCGWNTKLSKPYDDKNVLFPTIEDVIICLRNYIDNSEYSTDSKSDYKGAIETRLMGLTEGSTGLMLNSGHEISNEALFDKNVIVDLHRIGNSETVSLIMGILILKLNEYRMSSGGMNESLTHVTVLEEAHNILKRTSLVQDQESSNLVGKSVEMISNSIAEMRTYGEGFIIVDQSPAQVDLSAIRNTNTKIILALPEKDDCEIAGKSICLSDEQIAEINRQKVGQAIVYQNDWEEPVQCLINEFRESEPYKKKSDETILNEALDVSLNLDLIRFLVAGRMKLGPRFNLEKIVGYISKCTLPSTFKYTILKLVKEFNETGTCRIWKDENFKDLSRLVSLYVNKEDEVKSIMLHKQHSSSNEITNAIAELLSDDFLDLSKGEICTVIQCLMRHQSTKSTEMLEIYKQWKNN